MESRIHVDTALSERSKQVVAAIKKWDRQDIMELHALLMELKKIVLLFDQDPNWYISREQIPSAAIPPELASMPIWGCDLHGVCLLKAESEFSFRARAIADLAPGVHVDWPARRNLLELVPSNKKKRITIQLSEREYAGLMRAMMQDEERKVAGFVRGVIIKEIKARGIKV